jgi:signal transduction histidine kinase
MGTRSLLAVAFAVIAALFAAVAGCMLWRVTRMREQTRSLVADMLSSVELVSRLSRDVGRQRRLVDSHIFAKGGTIEMTQVEGEIAAAHADYLAAATLYDTLPQPPEEAALWKQLQVEVGALDAPVGAALALSRLDRNDEARSAMHLLMPRYIAVDVLVGKLIGVNHADADRTLQQLEQLQRSSLRLLALLALLGIVLSISVGALVTRSVQRGQEQLRRQSELLEAQNRDLDAFAGRVAHDLRGPLTTLKLAAASLARGTMRGRSLMMLERGIGRMTALIDDLLELSRAGGGRAACDPAATAASLREEMSPRLEEVGAQLTVEVEPARVRCAEGLLRQVLWNLLDNGLKYHRRGVPPELEIRGHAGDGEYQLQVRDNGIGMSPEEMSHAFEPLYRGGRVGTIDGTGLGLSLVKRVLEASGGHVQIESEVGRGTAFLIHVPRE